MPLWTEAVRSKLDLSGDVAKNGRAGLASVGHHQIIHRSIMHFDYQSSSAQDVECTGVRQLLIWEAGCLGFAVEHAVTALAVRRSRSAASR